MPERSPRDETEVDVGRRLFFRRFATDVVTAAATVVGAAQQLQQQSMDAARDILGMEDGQAATASDSAAPARADATASSGAASGFRTPFRWDGDGLHLIDQRKLPDELVEVDIRTAADGAWAIREMVVRGAPAIGQVAAISMALQAEQAPEAPFAFRAVIRGAATALRNARPTAVNLGWAVDRILDRYEAAGGTDGDHEAIVAGLRSEAESIVFEATTDHGRLASFGVDALPTPEGRPLRILTHCNTGPLACGQYGTALGVVQVAHHAGRSVEVFVDETRPYLQGARLTAWELRQAGVPHTLIADVAAGHLMSRGEVDVILVGADRIAANGDTANKVGTYTLAVLAARHGVPFYVCAPTSSVDLTTPTGAQIPIEERPADEVLQVRGLAIAPAGTQARNPAFDVTPADLITGILTEEGLLRAPFGTALVEAKRTAAERWVRERPFWADPTPSPTSPADEKASVEASAAFAPDGSDEVVV